MPKIQLKPQFVANPPRPKDKPKVDYFDTQLAGFMLEVRQTGKATYYLRYRDKNGKLRQVRIGAPETMSLDEARSMAMALKSQTIIGFDTKGELERLKKLPTFKDFVYQQYLPYAKTYKRSWELDQKSLSSGYCAYGGIGSSTTSPPATCVTCKRICLKVDSSLGPSTATWPWSSISSIWPSAGKLSTRLRPEAQAVSTILHTKSAS